LKESDIIDIKKSVLKLIPFLSEEGANRLKIYEKGDFTTLWNTFIGGNTNPDKSLLHLSIEALVRFVSDEKISLLFMTSEKLFETFDVLSKNLNLASAMPPTTKAAAIEMVSQLLRSGVIIPPLILSQTIDQKCRIRKTGVTKRSFEALIESAKGRRLRITKAEPQGLNLLETINIQIC